ncbi:MAG: hypothetical protein WDM86_00730 [Rhizomicrobium sp.]
MSKISCLAFLVMLAVASHASAQSAQHYANALTPLLDAVGGKTIGSLDPGAAVDVLGQSGGATQIAIHGWSAQGADATVFVAPDRHIVMLSGFSGQAVTGTSQTVNGSVYTAVTIKGWVPTGVLIDDVQVVWKSAGDLYAKSCASCHALPAATSYSAAQWPAIMKTQASNAGLDAGQAALITAYLQNQSGH